MSDRPTAGRVNQGLGKMTSQQTASANPAEYRVFVQPGCSSCLRTKEFLANRGIVHRVVDVANDPAGMAELLALGVQHIPVVAMGKDFVFAQNLEDVANFVGVELGASKRLPPEALVNIWLAILTVGQSYIRQMPLSCLGERPISGRAQSILDLGYHVFRIVEAFLDTVDRGVEQWIDNSMRPAPAGSRNGEAVAAYGDRVKKMLREWWGRQKDDISGDKVKTFQGLQSLHWFLERQTWHSTQHVRQLGDVLTRQGVQPSPALDPALLKDLPLPERLWE
jgi:glutaredoxin